MCVYIHQEYYPLIFFFCFDFIIFFLLLTLGLFCTCFPSSLWYKVCSFIFFSVSVHSAINFPLKTAFALYHNFGIFHFYFCLLQDSFDILFDFFLTHWLFKSVFDFTWENFLVSSSYWFLDSYQCVQKNIPGMISVLNLLRYVLWPNIWSVLGMFHVLLEKNMYSGASEWNVCICLKSIWSKM